MEIVSEDYIWGLKNKISELEKEKENIIKRIEDWKDEVDRWKKSRQEKDIECERLKNTIKVMGITFEKEKLRLHTLIKRVHDGYSMPDDWEQFKKENNL